MAKKERQKDEALILDIQRMSTEDGPGIRTTVFFKGCSLNCAWCHNPESISPVPQIFWNDTLCIGCQTCIAACPESALALTDAGMQINRSVCRRCGVCADACPSTALEMSGESWPVDRLVAETLKDRAYFETSGGGITVSGGEPGLQPEVVYRFLKQLREQGVDTALDTCGHYSESVIERLLPYAVLVLFDVKEIDDDRHRRYTGHSNRRILENLKRVGAFIRSHVYPRELWIRTPVIPGATARKENIVGIGRLIARHLGGVVTRWELCAFNNLCGDKYRRLGKPWPFDGCALMDKTEMEALADQARRSGVDPAIVCWSGATRLASSVSQHQS